MSFARVFSITALKIKNMKEIRPNATKTPVLEMGSIYLRNEEIIDTISMEVTRGCKLSSIIPVLQLHT